jgi:hypothetical protein
LIEGWERWSGSDREPIDASSWEGRILGSKGSIIDFDTISSTFGEVNLGLVVNTVNTSMVLSVLWVWVETVLVVIEKTGWHTWGGTDVKSSSSIENSFFDEVHGSRMGDNNFTFTWDILNFDSSNLSTEGDTNGSVDLSSKLGFEPSREGDTVLFFSVKVEDLDDVKDLSIEISWVFVGISTGTIFGSNWWGETEREVLSHWSGPDVVAAVWGDFSVEVAWVSWVGAVGVDFTTSTFSTVVELDVFSLTVSVSPFLGSLSISDGDVRGFWFNKMFHFRDEKSSVVPITFDFRHEIVGSRFESGTGGSTGEVGTFGEDISGELVGHVIIIGQLTDTKGWLVDSRVWEDSFFDVVVGGTPEEGSLVHVLVSIGVVVLEVAEADAEVSVEEDSEGVDVSDIVPGTFLGKNGDFSHVGITEDFLELSFGEDSVGLFRSEIFALNKSETSNDSN